MAQERGKNLDELTVAELRVRASKLEITGRSAMNKAELRQAVADAEEQLAGLEQGKPKPRSRSAASASKPQAKAAPKAKRSAPAAEGAANGGAGNAAGVAAPSVGPHTTIEKDPPEERLAKHEQSDVDAMGLDKRRGVVGGTYGPTAAKQATLYGAFLLVVAALVIGGKIAADELDKGPAVNEDKAPWSSSEAEQRPPAPIDFPRNPSP